MEVLIYDDGGPVSHCFIAFFRLLAVGGGLPQTQPLLTVKMTPSTPRLFGQRERSISAPNVNLLTQMPKPSVQVSTKVFLSFLSIHPIW